MLASMGVSVNGGLGDRWMESIDREVYMRGYAGNRWSVAE
jgi:hypothetical protein